MSSSQDHDTTVAGEETGGWTPVAGLEPRLELWELPDLDLLAELTHPVRSRVLRLLDTPHTVAEVAARLDFPVTRLYHHVNRLESLGLIRVVATRRVAAVTERRYQSVAAMFGVARDLRMASDPGELALALGALFDVAKMGFQREVEKGGYGDALDRSHSFLSLVELRLSPERRAELMARLAALVEDFGHDDIHDNRGDDTAGDATTVSLFIAACPDSG